MPHPLPVWQQVASLCYVRDFMNRTLKTAMSIAVVLTILVLGAAYLWWEGETYSALSGELHDDEAADLKFAVTTFLEAKNPGMLCLHKFLGRDDRYLYVERTCGVFGIVDGAVTMTSGDVVPTRLGWKKPSGIYAIDELSEPVDGSGFSRSLRAIFPREVYERWSLVRDRPMDLEELRSRLSVKGSGD